MLERIITDQMGIFEEIKYRIEAFSTENMNEDNAIYVLESIDNIMPAYEKNVPIVMYAATGFANYPVLKGTSIVENKEDLTEEYLQKFYNRHYALPNVVIRSDDFIIREITVNDVPALYEIYKEPEITAYMEGLYEDYEEELEFTIAYIENMYGFYDYGMWIMEDTNGKVIGRIGLSNREIDGESQIELGYVIAKPYQRKGYATKGCLAVMEYAKATLKKEEIYACINAHNLPSIKLAGKLGFEQYAESKCDGTDYIILKRIL